MILFGQRDPRWANHPLGWGPALGTLGQYGCFDTVRLPADQPPGCLPDHDAGEHEQERSLSGRRDALNFAMSVVMHGIGRLTGNAHGKISHYGRAQVDQRMRGFGKDRERT